VTEPAREVGRVPKVKTDVFSAKVLEPAMVL
jgi:hypothetical protein